MIIEAKVGEIFGLVSLVIDTDGMQKKGKVHPCTGTEALYRPYGP